MLSFKVVPPTEVYLGKAYSEWISDWCNWFYMANPDQYNAEPWNNVKFLRSFPSPSKIASLSPGEPVQYEGSPMYRNLPNIMTGSDKVIMYSDQALFFPLMLAIWINSDESDYGNMERWVKTQNANSDDPPLPHQFLINGLPIMQLSEISNYKMDSNGAFRVNIPNAAYGTSLKDFVIEPSQPGWYEAYCQGYFILINGLQENQTYTISSRVRGAPYNAGEYFASFFYEIQVLPTYLKPSPPRSGVFPESITETMKKEIAGKKTGDVTSKFNSYINTIEFTEKAEKCFLENKGDSDTAESYANMMLMLGNLKNTIMLKIVGDEMLEEIINKIINKLEFKILNEFRKGGADYSPEISAEEIDKVNNIILDKLNQQQNLQIPKKVKDDAKKLSQKYDEIRK